MRRGPPEGVVRGGGSDASIWDKMYKCVDARPRAVRKPYAQEGRVGASRTTRNGVGPLQASCAFMALQSHTCMRSQR